MMVTRLSVLPRSAPGTHPAPGRSASLEEPREQQQDHENQNNHYEYRYEPTPHFLTSLPRDLFLTNERQHEHGQKDYQQDDGEYDEPPIYPPSPRPLSLGAGYGAIYTFWDPGETGTVTKKRRPSRDAAGKALRELFTSCRPYRRLRA